MPVVTIQQSLREPEQKQHRVAAITEPSVDAYGVEPDQVLVFIHELGDGSWRKAGALASQRHREPSRARGAT